jgi:RHS repeat-associated protein
MPAYAAAIPRPPRTLTELEQATQVNGRQSTRAYNAATRTWTTTTPAGRISRTVLDQQGRPVRLELPGVVASELAYDAHGRLSPLTQGARVQSFAYDPASGYLQSVTDAMTHTTLFARDALGRALLQTYADGESVAFGFDAGSNLTWLAPPGRPAHTFSYTPVELLSQYAPPPAGNVGARVTQYQYDLDRALTLTTRPDGLTEQRSYDAAGRLSAIALPTGVISYTYDPSTGALATIAGPYGETLTYARDGRLTTSLTWSGPVAGTVSWTYDNDFRHVSENINGANEATFGYDPDGLMTTAGAQTRALDAASGMLGGTTVGNVTDVRTYNEYGEPASYTASYSGTPLLAVAYERDALGRIITKTETVEGTTHVLEYSYDLRGRLTDVLRDAALVEHYEYDANGIRTSFSNGSSSVLGTYDDQDRLLAYGSTSYEYTGNGELRSKHDSAGTTAYEYDVRGALRRVDLPTGSVVEYIVDGTGRRVGKKVNGVQVQGLLDRSMLHPVAELDGAGAVVGRFVYGTGVHVPEYVVRGEETYRIITDHLGSVRLVVNVATGEVVQRMEYDSFGRVLVDEVAAGWRWVPFGFAGGLYDPDTGLVRFGARDYDAEVGRWTGKDLIGFEGRDPNLYLYVAGDPVNHVDPSGRAVSGCNVATTVGGSAAGYGICFVMGMGGGWTGLACAVATGLAGLYAGDIICNPRDYEQPAEPEPDPCAYGVRWACEADGGTPEQCDAAVNEQCFGQCHQ